MRRRPAAWRRFWAFLRAVTGDDAYERYLAHHRARHGVEPPLDRAGFWRAELDGRGRRPGRCC